MRPQSHVTADIGEKAVALCFTNWGWTADPIPSDYGEDLDCQIFIDHERTPLHFRCQVKSSAGAGKSVRRLKSGDFTVRVLSQTCRSWLLAYYPVLLVVYDVKTGMAFWSNATEQVRAKSFSQQRKEVSLRVSGRQVLVDERGDIVSAVTAFYTRLLKVHSESVERLVIPVLMPGYRVVPQMETPDLLRVGSRYRARPEFVSVYRNSLPAWTTSLRTLDSQFLSGMSFRVANADLAEFSDLLALELATVLSPPGGNEWLAFVCGPIRFALEGDEESSYSVGRDLTGWWSYAKIGDGLVSDHDYAFEAPKTGFVRQIGQRARSWPGYYFVSVESDVTVQLLAAVATAPADRLSQEMLREHLLGQFLPWECPRSEVDSLQRMLWRTELVFAPIDVEGAEDVEVVEGAISTAMFAPAIGLIPQARNWRELEQGSVRSRIADARLNCRLPGSEGSAELRTRLLALVAHLAREAPDELIVDGTHTEPGLPVDLSRRRVVMQRMRERADFDADQAEGRLQEKANASLGDCLDLETLAVEAFVIEGFESVAVLSVSWSPALGESSAAAIERAMALIVALFDHVLPRMSEAPGRLVTTIDVLRFAGELYFEGDRLY